MIFVTVGSQLPFDRLIQGMDAWAGKNKEERVFAQIGDSKFKPTFLDYQAGLTAVAFREKFKEADVIVSHAGMGNVLLALELQKPLILMPRRAELKEHRNDHQMATVNWLKEKYDFPVAMEVDALDDCIRQARKATTDNVFSPYASQELIDAIRGFILQN